MDIITANVLRNQLINLRGDEQAQKKDAKDKASYAKTASQRLASTRAKLKAITAALQAAGYPTPSGDAIWNAYEDKAIEELG